jgi:hypothetical protein
MRRMQHLYWHAMNEVSGLTIYSKLILTHNLPLAQKQG